MDIQQRFFNYLNQNQGIVNYRQIVCVRFCDSIPHFGKFIITVCCFTAFMYSQHKIGTISFRKHEATQKQALLFVRFSYRKN